MSSETTNNGIALLAQELWERAGQPAGRDLEFWVEAERQALATPANLTSPNQQTNPVLVGTKSKAGANGSPKSGGPTPRQKVRTPSKKVNPRHH